MKQKLPIKDGVLKKLEAQHFLVFRNLPQFTKTNIGDLAKYKCTFFAFPWHLLNISSLIKREGIKITKETSPFTTL